MAIARKIAYNVAFSSVSKVISTVLALVSIGLITRYLGKEGFGDYATVLAFLSFFSAFFDLGLYSVSTREISRPGADEEKIMGNIFSLRVFSSLLVFILAPIVILILPYPADVEKGILIIAASFVFSSSYQVLNGVFQKNLSMDKVALSELIGKILQVGMVFLAVTFNWGFGWIISSLLLNMVVSFFLVFLWSRRFLRLKISVNLDYWKGFLRESFPVGIASLITFIYFKVDTILLSLMKDSSDVGIYNAAYKVIENITFFPAMIVGLVLPILSQNIFHDRERFAYVSDKTFKIFVVLVIPLLVATLFLAKDIIWLIGGDGFSESAGVLRILVFALVFIFFGNLFNAIIISANFQKKLMIILGAAATINVALNLFLIPRFSYLGAAGVSAVTEFIVALSGLIFISKKLKYFPRLEKFGLALVSGILMAIFLFVLRGGNFFLLAIGSSAVYGLSLWIFGVIKTEEVKSIIAKEPLIQE